MLELCKQFRFDAAHTLNRSIETGSSQRIHGHSYRAEIAIRGNRDTVSGMIIDLGLFERSIADARDALDHHFLDEVPELGPATMENLSAWIWARLEPKVPNLFRVSVFRDSSGDACSYWGKDVNL